MRPAPLRYDDIKGELVAALKGLLDANTAVDNALAGDGDAADRLQLSVAQRNQDGAEVIARAVLAKAGA